VHVAELKRKSVPELLALAASLHVSNTSGLRKQELVFRIEQALLDAETTLLGEGVLELLPEGYGFLRAQDFNYLHGPDDIYVSPSQVKRFDLRTGDTVMGEVRPPKVGERYLALLKVERINGGDPEQAKLRSAFDNLTPKYPDERIRLERANGEVATRLCDLVAPLGKGQRALIVAPPKGGKTILLQQMANAILENHPEMVVIILTGHGSLDSAIAGMRHGIFDYLLKTTEPAQVIERVRAGLLTRAREQRRRTLIETLDAAVNELRGGDERAGAASTTRTIVLGGLQLDTWHQSAMLHGQALALTPTEFRVLLCLAEHAGTMLSYAQLVRCAQGYDASDLEAGELIKPHIHHLRQKLEPEPSAPRYILNVRGKGYLLASTVER